MATVTGRASAVGVGRGVAVGASVACGGVGDVAGCRATEPHAASTPETDVAAAATRPARASASRRLMRCAKSGCTPRPYRVGVKGRPEYGSGRGRDVLGCPVSDKVTALGAQMAAVAAMVGDNWQICVAARPALSAAQATSCRARTGILRRLCQVSAGATTRLPSVLECTRPQRYPSIRISRRSGRPSSNRGPLPWQVSAQFCIRDGAAMAVGALLTPISTWFHAGHTEFGRWGDVFGDAVVAAAMIDRLDNSHHASVVTLKGDSYQQHRSDQMSPAGRTPRATPGPSVKGDLRMHSSAGNASAAAGRRVAER